MRPKLLVPLVIVVVAAGVWVWWQQGGPGGPVSGEAARRYFARIVDAAQAKNFEALCRLSASVGTCEAELRVYWPESFGADAGSGPQFPAGEELEQECRESVPTEPPEIMVSRHRPGGDGSVGGRLLVVSGVDGRGNPYETEVLVFRDKRSYKATHAVFWSGATFEDPNRVQAEREGDG